MLWKAHCLLYFNFSNERVNFFDQLGCIDENNLSRNNSNISNVVVLVGQSFNDVKNVSIFFDDHSFNDVKDISIFFGSHLFNDVKNISILVATTEFINSTKRFDAPLYQN